MKDKIKVDDDFRVELKRKREQMNMTQSDVANVCSISLQRYSRIETGSVLNIPSDILSTLEELFALDISKYVGNYAERITIRIPRKLYSELQMIKINFEYDTLTDAVLHCLQEYTDDFFMKKCKYEIEDIVKDTIVNTYEKAMIKLHRENEMQLAILDKIEEDTGVVIDEYKEEIKEEIIKRNHAKKY